MSKSKCNFQKTVDLPDLKAALANGFCDHCGATVSELIQRGEILELCGQEHCFDYETGESIEIAIALCPTCHQANHLDAQRQHNPCHVSARRSRDHHD
jgi:NMD protein affecting ribosome stability and mRNA decay